MERGGFIFYKSFYDSIKELDPQDQVQIYNAIFKFQFENELVELKGIAKSIFTLIIPQLKANNKRYENGCKGGRPKQNQNETKQKPKNNQNETKLKPKEKEKENDKEKVKVNEYYIDAELNDIFKEYLQVRKKIGAVNSDRAIKTLLNKLSKYDDETKYKMIEKSIVNSWKDVYELKDNEKQFNRITKKTIEETPEWFDKELKNEEMTEEEKTELDSLLNDIDKEIDNI